jgi:nucleoside diphosphate kinase
MHKIEYTFFMLKPDAVARNITDNILSSLEGAGLKIIYQQMKFLKNMCYIAL